jgi:putative transposase
LVGGGLTRSVGRGSEVVSMRRRGERQLSDERILGSGEFVQKILEETEEKVSIVQKSRHLDLLNHTKVF